MHCVEAWDARGSYAHGNFPHLELFRILTNSRNQGVVCANKGTVVSKRVGNYIRVRYGFNLVVYRQPQGRSDAR